MPAPAKYLDANGETAYRRYARSRPVKWWHESIIDDMLLHPTDTHAQRGARLGYSSQAVMMLINSDMFKAAYEARRGELRSRLDDGITQKLLKTANLGLDLLHKKMEEKQTSIPFKDLLEANNSLLSRLGYGVEKNSGTNVQVNVGTQAPPAVTSEALAQARQRLREVEQTRALGAPAPSAHMHTIDVTPAPAAEPYALPHEGAQATEPLARQDSAQPPTQPTNVSEPEV